MLCAAARPAFALKPAAKQLAVTGRRSLVVRAEADGKINPAIRKVRTAPHVPPISAPQPSRAGGDLATRNPPGSWPGNVGSVQAAGGAVAGLVPH